MAEASRGKASDQEEKSGASGLRSAQTEADRDMTVTSLHQPNGAIGDQRIRRRLPNLDTGIAALSLRTVTFITAL